MYLIFFFIYIILVSLQTYAVKIQKHPVAKLFTTSLTLEFISLCFSLAHLIKFALNGIGYPKIEITGSIFHIFSRVSLVEMLICLLLS